MSDRGFSTDSPRYVAKDTDMSVSSVTPSPPPAIPPPPVGALPTPADPKLEKVPAGLRAPYHPRPLTSTCLKKHFTPVGGLFFQNMAGAKASMDFAQWRSPSYDNTIPQTDKEHQDIVQKLVLAFKDMSAAKDTPDNAYRKRLTPGEAMYYQDWAIEACAWDILSKVKTMHTEGFKVAIYDKSIVDSIGQTQYWTFQERIEWICVVLRTSKNVAVTLMKNEKTWTILGAPHKLYHSTLTNAVANAHRGVWVKSGREADTEHRARANSKRQKLSHAVGHENDGAKDAMNTRGKEGNPDIGTAPASSLDKTNHINTSSTPIPNADSVMAGNPVSMQNTPQLEPMPGITYHPDTPRIPTDPEREPALSRPSHGEPSTHSLAPHTRLSASDTQDQHKVKYDAVDLEGAEMLASLHTAC